MNNYVVFHLHSDLSLLDSCTNYKDYIDKAKELGQKAVLVATGGYSGLIANYLERPFDYINPTLTLEGLRHLYNLNIVSELQKVSH